MWKHINWWVNEEKWHIKIRFLKRKNLPESCSLSQEAERSHCNSGEEEDAFPLWHSNYSITNWTRESELCRVTASGKQMSGRSYTNISLLQLRKALQCNLHEQPKNWKFSFYPTENKTETRQQRNFWNFCYFDFFLVQNQRCKSTHILYLCISTDTRVKQTWICKNCNQQQERLWCKVTVLAWMWNSLYCMFGQKESKEIKITVCKC